jgi:transcription termination/antitermination protein NusG
MSEPQLDGVTEPTPSGQPLVPVVEAEAPWFAIWTRSRAEKAVADQLDRKRIEVFLPTVQRWSRWKDRKKKIDWPLFPGYCFARFDPRGSLDVLKCEGVAKVICFDGKPAPIPHSEIEAIQRLVETELQFDPCPLLHEGDLVEVTHGPLKGVTGRLVHKGPKTKLVLSVTMINRAVAVTFDVADVRKY